MVSFCIERKIWKADGVKKKGAVRGENKKGSHDPSLLLGRRYNIDHLLAKQRPAFGQLFDREAAVDQDSSSSNRCYCCTWQRQQYQREKEKPLVRKKKVMIVMINGGFPRKYP